MCNLATQSAVPQVSHLYGWAYSLGGSAVSHPISLHFLHDGEGFSFLGLVPSDDTVNSESVMGIKPGDSGVVIGYQVDEFTHTWSAECFVAHFHIYPGFTGKVSLSTHFPLEPGCEDYVFLDQAVADFKQGLDSILTDSLETWELDTSLDEPDAITSSVSSWFLHLVSTLSDNSKPQHAPSILTYKLWCQARVLLAPVSLATKMSASKLIHYFLSHPAAFGFQASTHQITSLWILPSGKLISLSWIFRLVLVLLHMLLLTQSNSSLTSRLPLLILFLTAWGRGRCYTCLWSVRILKIHDMLDKAISKQVGNSAHILAYLFNSVSRQHCEAWASQFPFLHSLKEVIPPS